MDLSPGTVIRPSARPDGATTAASAVVGMIRTIAFAFLRGIGVVLHFKPVQPEADLSSTFSVPHHVRDTEGKHRCTGSDDAYDCKFPVIAGCSTSFRRRATALRCSP